MDRTVTPYPNPRMFSPRVVANVELCREHYRLVLAGENLAGSKPGQFLHIAPSLVSTDGIDASSELEPMGTSCAPVPLLRRAFSIAGLRSSGGGDGCEVELIYRVVGTATKWLSSLRSGDSVSAIGPLGNAFPIQREKTHAWLVGGGVGLPPMLWLGEALSDASRQSVAFVGARSAELLALTVGEPGVLSRDATRAVMGAREFEACDTPVVISTDDGSLGYRGHAAAAMAAYFGAMTPDTDDLVVYTCGPEVMMEAVARFCIDRGIECYVCMERSMACGTGTCQSCVVAVDDASATDGWCYELCCAQGPVFDASRVRWPSSGGGGVQH